jgi:hypothetical protein
LLDLNGQKPRLYVVENELAAHDPLRHVAIQILQFSLSFEAEPRKVRNILFETLQSQGDLKLRCEDYASTHYGGPICQDRRKGSCKSYSPPFPSFVFLVLE